MDQKKQGQQSEGFTGQQEPQTGNSDREPAEGPRHTPSEEERHVPGSEEEGHDRSGGITNRDLDREMDEQEELPERGETGHSER